MEIIPVHAEPGQEVPIAYAIYPSLLDAFIRYKKHDDDETFDSLLFRINKVKSEQTESQLKGVEFEKCVNDLIDKKDFNLTNDASGIETDNFQFPLSVVQPLASKLQYCTGKQKYMEVIIHTHLGNIKLYGIVDYEFEDMIVDLKGTDNYKCNKYKDSTQHPVYSLIRKLKGKPLKQFKYLVTDYVNVFQETYIPTENMFDKLMITIYEFIAFINYYKGNITDEKIFGKETRPLKTSTPLSEVR